MPGWVPTHQQLGEVSSTSAHDITSPGQTGGLPGDNTHIILNELPPGVSEDNYHGLPNGPPPGLVRVLPPVPVDEGYIQRQLVTRVFSDYDIVMFGKMAKYLTGFDVKGNRIILDLTCQICGDLKLDVPPIVTPRRSGRSNRNTEPFTVLPCGHFFGDYCLRRWFDIREEQDEFPPECPYCRFPLIHELCGHTIKLTQFDPRFPRAGQTPLTIPEGGIVTVECPNCAKRDLESAASRVIYRVFPDVRETTFIDPDQCDAKTFEALRNRMWDDIFSCYGWGEKQFEFW
ncbi:hypothetical protein Hte_000078 [Hypoxylon texense]